MREDKLGHIAETRGAPRDDKTPTPALVMCDIGLALGGFLCVAILAQLIEMAFAAR